MLAGAAVLLVSLAAQAQGVAATPPVRPADAPTDATGICGDGDFTRKAERRGACRGRDGVKVFWGPPGAAASSALPASSASRVAPDKRESGPAR
jgi:hypothetical protein